MLLGAHTWLFIFLVILVLVTLRDFLGELQEERHVVTVVAGKEMGSRREGVTAVTELLLKAVQLGLQSDLFEARESCRSLGRDILIGSISGVFSAKWAHSPGGLSTSSTHVVVCTHPILQWDFPHSGSFVTHLSYVLCTQV